VAAEHRWNVEAQMTKHFRERATGCYNIDDGKKQSPASRAKKSAARKRAQQVLDIETGITYTTCTECAKATGKSNSYITTHPARFVYERNRHKK